MSKKTKIVYLYLALFAFTLGFSFTLASNAQADSDPPICCVYQWCEGYEGELVGIWGHGTGTCVFDMRSECDIVNQCPYTGQ